MSTKITKSSFHKKGFVFFVALRCFVKNRVLWLLWALLAAGPTVAAAQDTPATVRATGEVLKREYIDVEVAAEADATPLQGLWYGRYAGASTPEALAPLLNNDLRDITHDKHIFVEVIQPAASAAPSAPTGSPADARAARAEAVRRTNAGVRRVEILPGNVGDLDLAHFC